ncbi:glutamine amidotransferase-related protein [Herbiconiux daphne]|uniref:Glutamine amidotransferase n=1 Tax=Herbiconiux daphne TaxID=2970914 RepID=A0ABT2GW26_9MICO|nr:glutamine amidotransferase [Herbiconiux daphne]MCS5732159.1 glutamine amidotransferase [Herbiconiux daphne]
MTGRHAVVIRNERAAGLGNFEPVLLAHGYTIEVIDAEPSAGALPAAQGGTAPSDTAQGGTGGFAAALAAASGADLVIVLGSSRGVYENDRHDFIDPEIAFVRERLARSTPTLGVCFGAQVIAAALGAPVHPGPGADVGYRDVTPTADGLASPLRHVAGVPMAEWHGDTFPLPEGTVRLASSARYQNEAFGIGDWLLAVQFHPELTDEMHEQWLADDEAYVLNAGYSPAALRADRETFGAGMQTASQRMLADYLDRIARLG